MTQAYRALGAVALRKGDISLLLQSAQSFIAVQPTSPDGYIMRASARAAARNIAEADADLQKSIRAGSR